MSVRKWVREAEQGAGLLSSPKHWLPVSLGPVSCAGAGLQGLFQRHPSSLHIPYFTAHARCWQGRGRSLPTVILSDEEWWGRDDALFYLSEQLKVLNWHSGSLILDTSKEKDSSSVITLAHSEKTKHIYWDQPCYIFLSFVFNYMFQTTEQFRKYISSTNIGRVGGLLGCFPSHFSLKTENHCHFFFTGWAQSTMYRDGQCICSQKVDQLTSGKKLNKTVSRWTSRGRKNWLQNSDNDLLSVQKLQHGSNCFCWV